METLKRKRNKIIILSFVLIIALLINGCSMPFFSNDEDEEEVSKEVSDYNYFTSMDFESDSYFIESYTEENNICTGAQAVNAESFNLVNTDIAAGLFDINNRNIIEGYRLYDRLYPASTTKILTGYLAIKYGNLDDMVTVSENALNLEPESQVCGLEVGDKVSLYDLLNGLLLHSGNDAAIAVAEHISGSVEEFVNLMNEEAYKMGATGTHFSNPSGLHAEDHYTTAYDLYLIFNECRKITTFAEIINRPSYEATIVKPDGSTVPVTWNATNYYFAGEREAPDNVNVLGGKTGTTNEAGCCLILYSSNTSDSPYISIILNAVDKTELYDLMNNLLTLI